MTINTDVRRPHLTKLAKYMFFIEHCLYFPKNIFEAFQKLEKTTIEDFDPINVYIDDENSTDYSINEQLESDEPDYIYHIVVDTRNPRFAAQLNELKKSEKFVDCYQYKDTTSNKAVIRYKVSIKSRLEKLISSEYSKMFDEQEYGSLLLRNKPLVRMYTHYSFDNQRDELDSSLHVIMHTEEMLHRLIDQYNITSNETIAIMSSNEFASKYSIDKETLKFENI